MRTHKVVLFLLVLLCWVASACTLPGAVPTPTAAKVTKATRTALAALAALSAVPASPAAIAASATPPAIPTLSTNPTAASGQVSATQVPSTTFCADAQVTTLINSLKSALQTSNGPLLASLVSPTHGMEARLYRNGTVITYDQHHAKFLFETTYVVDWGAAPASGTKTMGSFHETIVPALKDVFNKNYTLTCNQVQVGGASYPTTWPYTGINFYSVYYPGTQANGSNDWHTWLLGMHYVNGRPYLYAIMQFQWEP